MIVSFENTCTIHVTHVDVGLETTRQKTS